MRAGRVAPEYTESDAETEFTLRPQTLQEYIGQDKVKENLAIYIEAAKRRGEPLDHVLLYGSSGDWVKLLLPELSLMKWVQI